MLEVSLGTFTRTDGTTDGTSACFAAEDAEVRPLAYCPPPRNPFSHVPSTCNANVPLSLFRLRTQKVTQPYAMFLLLRFFDTIC